MQEANLILVRHGQSLWNLENKFTGQKDIDLTEAGIKEAENAGKDLENNPIDVAYTSTLIRAQHTLAIILEFHKGANIPIIIDAALNERSYGNLEGLNKAETAEKYGEPQVHIWRRSFDIAPPGGESLQDTYKRVIPYFKENILPDLLAGKNCLIVAHGNSLRSLVMYLDNLTKDQILQKEIPTGTPVFYNLSTEKLNSFENRD